jgi:ketopantoate reductase
MEELKHYRKVVRELIEHYAQVPPSLGEVRVEVVFDESDGHYELIYSGWHDTYRIQGSVLHIDIRDGKAWIQHDGTEDRIADELVRQGIPKERIVLAFKHPDLRPHTGFAVA